jgi:hypothetical protein
MDTRRLSGPSVGAAIGRGEPFHGATARALRIAKTFAPGHDGTRRLAREFGDRLVCVRHRYDDANALRVTTVEIVAHVDPLHGRSPPPRQAVAARAPVWIRLAPDERELRRKVLDAGGRWHRELKLWEAPRWLVTRLALGDRVVGEQAESAGGPG